MTMNMTRKDFCGALLGGTVLLFIQGCGGGGSDSGSTMDSATPTPTPSPPSGGNPSSGCTDSIAANHGHVLAVALADLDSATDKTYDIQGGADHTHTVILTVSQLRALKTGVSVSTTSSTTLAHQHDIAISCI